MSADFVKHN